MEKIKKILIKVVVVVWAAVALFGTICLLSRNDFATTVLGKNTLLMMDNDELEPKYMEGDLLVVKRASDNKIAVGDNVFYYNSSMNTSKLVFFGKVENKEEVGKSDVTYTIDGEKVSGEYVIGNEANIKTYHHLGTLLNALVSKWGFLFFGLFPMLFAMIYEAMLIIDERKNNKKVEEKNTSKDE